MGETRVLLISYLFPPCGGVGVQRALGMARYLPECGVRLSVLTAKNPISQHGSDPDLVRKIPSSVSVFRSGAWEPPKKLRQWVKGGGEASASAQKPAGTPPKAGGGGLRALLKAGAERLLFPDAQVLWTRPALAEACSIIEREKIRNVVLTMPPFSLLGMASGLRRRFPDLRIILDLRDEWLNYHLVEMDTGASAWKRAQAAVLEGEAVACSDSVVTVTETWVDVLRRRYPRENPGKFVYVPNGFDHDLLGKYSAPRPPAPPLIVGYMGTVYTNGVYSPKPYLDALDALAEPMRSQVETRFFGRISADADPLFANRAAPIVRTGFLPQEEGFARLAQSHALLLIVGNATVHSAKLFEYLAMQIPILAISPPEGEVGKLIRELDAGWCVGAGDAKGLVAAIGELFQRAAGGDPHPGPARAGVERYHRRNLMNELIRQCGLLES